MLNNIWEFQKLHIHTQRVLYVAPLLFIYFFLLPSHYQLLANIDEYTIIKIFDSVQKFLLLIEIWLQYIGFRFILSPELKEVSICNTHMKKSMWFISNLILSFFFFLPYVIAITLKSRVYFLNIPILFFQCLLIGEMTFFLMCLLKSALGGLAVMIGYYFLCVNYFLPQKICIIVLGALPINYSIDWYIVQILFAIVFLVGTFLMERIKYTYS